MSGYTKLFSSIVHSTVWREPNHVRLVWVTLLALADRDGRVEASVPGLADAARVSIDECEQALTKLGSPDPYSRSPEHEGRRLAPIRGGWELLNHANYREKSSLEDRKEKARERKQRQRDRERDKRDASGTGRDESEMSRVSRQAEAEAEADTKTPEPPPEKSRPERDKPKRRKPKTPIHESWTPNAAHSEKCAKLGLNLDAEARKFRNNAEGKDVRWADWDKAFHNWLENGATFASNGPGKPPGAVEHERQQAAENAKLIEQAKRGEYGAPTQKLANDGRLTGDVLKRFREAIRAGNLKRRVLEPARPNEPRSSPRATESPPVAPAAVSGLVARVGRAIP